MSVATSLIEAGVDINFPEIWRAAAGLDSIAQAAEVTVPELPGRVFHGKLARNAGALQSDPRTVLAEVDVDNEDGALAPGLYAIVHLSVPRTYRVFVVPSQSVIFDKSGLSAAIYDNGVISFAKARSCRRQRRFRRSACRIAAWRPADPQSTDRRGRWNEGYCSVSR